MFKKARDIIREQVALGAKPSEIRRKLRDETTLSIDEVRLMTKEVVPEEYMKRAHEILQEMLAESGIPEAMARDLLMTGARTKNVAALRTAIRRRLKAETCLTFAQINEMVGLERGSHYLSGERSKE